ANGTRDSGEAFEDLNENGAWDAALPTSWVRATEVTPSLNFQPGSPAFQKEWRFNYANIPASGTGTIKVRLRELSSAAFKDFAASDEAGHFTTLERSVNTAGPDIRMFIAYPQNNGDTIGDNYVMKCYFTKALADGLTTQQLIDRFTVRLGGNDEASTLTAYPRVGYSIVYNETAQYHALAFTLPNLYNDQPDYLHKLEVTHDRPAPTPDLAGTRLLKFSPSQVPRISIVTPPELDSDGKPFEIVLPDKASPTAEDRQYLVRVSTGLEATSVVMTVNSGPVTFTGPVTSIEGSTKFWDFTWTNVQQGEFRFTATVNPGGNENHDTRNARVFFRQVVPVSAPDPDDDDDGLLDGDEATATPLPNRFPTDDARYKPNPEQWTNGDIHIYFAYGRSNPLSPDSDGDLLPDGLEVGWRNAVVVGEAFSDVGYGTPTVGAGNGLFDWNDANSNGAHDVGETSEPFTDLGSPGNGKFDFGTSIGRDTNGDGIANFIGDLDPPFYNTLDNLGKVPQVNSASEGGDRAKQLRGSVTNPNDADTDDDGIKDGIEDANRNGWLDGDGASIPVNFNPWLARNWPDNVRNPGETWTETSPNDADTDDDGAADGFGEDKNFDGQIAGDTNQDRTWQSGEVWSETDPLTGDTDDDGLPDGWEKRYNLDPLDSGSATFTGLAASAVNGAGGNPDGDLNGDGSPYTNAQELANGTSPRENNSVPPPPPGSIIIGPQTPIVAGGVSHNREFTDWAIGDLIVLDQYDGDGSNNQGGDVYHANDGFDSSRDLVAFYAHDGGEDGLFHFRVDMQDLKAFAEQGNLDIYVVMDFNSPTSGESALPDDIDTRTNMKWEVCVACYATDIGAVLVDTPASSNSTSINQNLTDFGVVRRNQSATNGFKKSYFNSTLDAVEFSISRQALLDAGWNGDSTKLNYQVFTTKDGTQNSPTVGPGNIGGRSDIRDSIYDDSIASDYWRDQSSISGQGSVLYSWFGVATGAGNDRFKRAKVVSLIHEARPLIPGSETQALINTGASAGFYRPLDLHEAFGVPLALHIPPTLASAFQWAKVDPAVNKSWRDGPSFNSRLGALATGGVVQFLGTTFADHPLPYFPQSYTNDNVALANEWMSGFYGIAPSANVLYAAERVLGTEALSRVQGAGFGFTIADQMRHYLKWFGRTSALGSDGYRINRVNGVKLIAVSDQASGFRFLNTDGGLGTSLRELLNRKARSGQQDQVVVLGSDWSDFLSKPNADAYDTNVKWLASRPWIQLTTPQAIAAGSVDSNADGNGDTWNVVERGNASLAPVAKDYIDHATQENYDHWFFGQSGREESLKDKIFNIRPGAPLPLAWGQVGVQGLSEASWTHASGISATHSGLRALGRSTFHAATYLTAFHDQANGDLSKFSTGDYINPDTTLQSLAGFSKAAQSQARWAAVLARVAQWATDANGGLVTLSATQEDVDLDGENECLLCNARIFAVFERIGGRLTAAWVRDLANGKVFQCVGNPVAYSGFETEEEGGANVIGGLVGSYRTSGLKDWFAAGPDSIAYNNDLYAATSAPSGTGWQFTSSDGKIAKTVTLAALGN
ncbi:MAG: hypothetical protein ACOYMN_11535, partial [Roseimicrobium sp.]